MTDSLKKAETIKDVMDMTVLNMLGIPYDLVAKVSKANEAMKTGQKSKTVEALAPTFAANMLAAYRLATEGQTTSKGKPVEEGKTLGTGQAIGKALGFQPMEITQGFEQYQAGQAADKRRSAKVEQLAKAYLDAGKNMSAIRKDLDAWNKEMEGQGRRSMTISLGDVTKRSKSLTRKRKPTKREQMRREEYYARTGS